MFEEIELRIAQNLKLQLQKNPPQGVLTPQNWLVQKLKNLDNFRQNNLKIMQDYKPISATQQLLQASFQNGIIQTNAFLNLQNSPNFFGINSDRLNDLMGSITTLERHSETAILRMTDDVYRRTLHLAELEMSAGTNLETAIDMATKSFLEQGINCIVYKDGRRVNIADYVRMALRTASMKATLHGRSERFAQLGYDTVLITQYDRCSDTCLPWQGRVYIEDTFTLWNGEVKEVGEELWGKSNYCGKWFPLLSTAIEKGLFHPNCRHDMGLYIDGRTKIPEPIDAEKDLENYKIEQHQRALECKIRKAKRLVLGTLDKDTAKVYRKQLRALQSELKQFVSEHSDILKREYGREKIYDEETQNNSQNGLTNGGDSGIINLNSIDDDFKPVTQNSIDSVPNLNIFENEQLNLRHQQASKDLLTEIKARNLPVETEMSIIYDGNMNPIKGHGYVVGENTQTTIDTYDKPFHAFHNHPAGETFSFVDLLHFSQNPNMISLTAQGNNGENKYTIIADTDCDKSGFYAFLDIMSAEPFYRFNDKQISFDYIKDEKTAKEAKEILSSLNDSQKREFLNAGLEFIENNILNGVEDYGIRYIKT